MFRPSTREFPVSRGRYLINIEADGNCVFEDIAATDGSFERACHVRELPDQTHIEITYPDWIRKFNILTLEQNKLVLAELL